MLKTLTLTKDKEANIAMTTLWVRHVLPRLTKRRAKTALGLLATGEYGDLDSKRAIMAETIGFSPRREDISGLTSLWIARLETDREARLLIRINPYDVPRHLRTARHGMDVNRVTKPGDKPVDHEAPLSPLETIDLLVGNDPWLIKQMEEEYGPNWREYLASKIKRPPDENRKPRRGISPYVVVDRGVLMQLAQLGRAGTLYLFLYTLGGHPTSLRRIMKKTGWRYTTVRNALAELEKHGLLSRTAADRPHRFICTLHLPETRERPPRLPSPNAITRWPLPQGEAVPCRARRHRAKKLLQTLRVLEAPEGTSKNHRLRGNPVTLDNSVLAAQVLTGKFRPKLLQGAPEDYAETLLMRGTTPRRAMYETYLAWCRQQRRCPVSYIVFNRRLRKAGVPEKRRVWQANSQLSLFPREIREALKDSKLPLVTLEADAEIVLPGDLFDLEEMDAQTEATIAGVEHTLTTASTKTEPSAELPGVPQGKQLKALAAGTWRSDTSGTVFFEFPGSPPAGDIYGSEDGYALVLPAGSVDRNTDLLLADGDEIRLLRPDEPTPKTGRRFFFAGTYTPQDWASVHAGVTPLDTPPYEDPDSFFTEAYEAGTSPLWEDTY